MAGLLALAVPVTACDSLLEVELPGQVPAAVLDDPAMIPTLVVSAVADFECAWSEYVLSTAVFTEEITTSSAQVTWNQMDPRTQSIETFDAGCANSQGTILFGTYRPLHTARYQAEDTYRRVTERKASTPDAEQHLALLAAYAGYTYTLLGEGYCDGTIAIDRGPLVSRSQLQGTAKEWFTRAITHAQAAGATNVRHMATLGRARAQLNLNETAGALADARTIPEGFLFEVSRSDHIPARHNRIFQAVNLNRHGSVDPAFWNLQVQGVRDPRVDVSLSGFMGGDGVTVHWNQNKYTSRSSPMPLATWREAQLIIAEIEGGQAAVDAINRLRRRANLPLFASSDPEEIRRQVLEERRREQFLEGHWINTKIRHNLPWEQGRNAKGIAYGDLTCLPMSSSERENNANVRG